MSQANKHQYTLYPDGLGTFLRIAASTLEKRAQMGEITPDDATILQGQIYAAHCCFGSAMEALGMERIDFFDNANSASAGALMMAGRYIQEMAEIADTLQTVQKKHKQEVAEWPPC